MATEARDRAFCPDRIRNELSTHVCRRSGLPNDESGGGLAEHSTCLRTQEPKEAPADRSMPISLLSAIAALSLSLSDLMVPRY